jgi:hypothetical protein
MIETLTLPNFVDKFTPANPLGWLQSMEQHIIVRDIPCLRPSDSGIERVEQFYRRARLIALLTGRLAPANGEQAGFLAAVEQGQPVILLEVEADFVERGLAPTLRWIQSGWRWEFGVLCGAAVELLDALADYADSVAAYVESVAALAEADPVNGGR